MADFTANQNWDRTFRTPGGMVGRWLRRQGMQVKSTAKTLAPKDTGKLSRSIKVGPVGHTNVRDLYIEVTADTPYAAAVHEGARPHTITVGRGRIMVFEVDDRTIFTRRVNHPGNKGNPFLAEALASVFTVPTRTVRSFL